MKYAMGMNVAMTREGDSGPGEARGAAGRTPREGEKDGVRRHGLVVVKKASVWSSRKRAWGVDTNVWCVTVRSSWLGVRWTWDCSGCMSACRHCRRTGEGTRLALHDQTSTMSASDCGSEVSGSGCG